jgi:hypothetical protein
LNFRIFLQEFEVAEADAKISGMVLSPTDAPQNATASVEARNPTRAEEHVAQAQEQLAMVAEGQSVQYPESSGTSQRALGSREGFFGLLDKLENVNSTQVITSFLFNTAHCEFNISCSAAPTQVN